VQVRRPTQAGSFYAGDAEALKQQVESCFLHEFGPGKLPKVDVNGPRKIVGLVCPHAGYMYSGPVAANAYSELALDGKPDTVVILGPNHTGYGSALSLMDEGVWRTPLGDVEVDWLLMRLCETAIGHRRIAHRFEHSIEVQLPFCSTFSNQFKFGPLLPAARLLQPRKLGTRW
jgi:AmmeMemoRadiSam system protein B